MGSSELHLFAPKGVLSVWGEDAATFLQGQFSQDLRIERGAMAYGLWLNQKGKILADSFIGRVSEDEFLVLSYFGESARLQSNLESRIIMDEVETEIPTASWHGISLWGDAVDVALDAMGLERPEPGRFVAKEDVYVFWGRRGARENVEIVSRGPDALARAKDALDSDSIRPMTDEEASVRSIEDFRFEVGRDITDDDLPQEVGLDQVAVAYSKGCYIGQEVMARLHAMGRARRALNCVALSGRPKGEGPWKLIGADGRKAGELRRCLEAQSGPIGSAMIKASSVVDTIRVDSDRGIEARVVGRSR
ncbi:MAG: hypothetical protein CBD18_04640 [Opitutales bacterium TMED158]|nr:MAG: hypothetical protein CBD18_04640 [Opitutales bacterium TMED158]